MRARLAVRTVLALAFAASVARGQEHGATVPSGATPTSEGRADTTLRPPRLVVSPPADYPAGETRSSRVSLALTVDADGRVRQVEVLESGGQPFDEAAAAAAERLVFEPAQMGGRAVAVKIRYVLAFTSPRPTAPAAPPPASPSTPATDAGDVAVHGTRAPRDVTSVTVSAAQGGKVAGTQGDPIKVLEDLPGLARSSFGSGQIIVWGAAPTDTRTYVDGVEVPALFHGGGLRSTVNGDLVRDVTLTPGAYGASYGRGIGGNVLVQTKDLPPDGLHGYAGADVLDGAAMGTASLGSRVRVGVAGRYGWVDDVLRAVASPNIDEYFAIPKYDDMQAKVQVRLRDRESFDVVFLASHDDLTQNIPDADPSHARSERTTLSYERLYARYRYQTDEGAAIDVTPWVGHDASLLDASFGGAPATLDEGTWRWGLRASHVSRPWGTVTLTVGGDVEGSSANVSRAGSLYIPPREGDITVFGQPPGDQTNADSWSAGVVDIAPYVTADVQLGPLSVSGGLRFDAYVLQTSRQTPRVGQTPSIGFEQLRGELGPRLSARLAVTSRLSILGAAGVYSQPPDPADLSAVFGNPTLGPETAEHATVGQALELTRDLSFETLAFAKWMTGLAVRNPAEAPMLAQALLDEGVGRAYGVQMLVRQRPWHGLYGWVAYTISRSLRRDTPTSGWRLFDYDQPHVLTAVASKELGAWTFGARFRFASGFPRTPVLGAFYDAKDDVYQPIFGAQNSVRLPSFWQIDLRVDRSFRIRDAARVLVYLEGLNVTNRANAEEYYYNVDYTRRGVITGLPAIASIGARVDL